MTHHDIDHQFEKVPWIDFVGCGVGTSVFDFVGFGVGTSVFVKQF